MVDARIELKDYSKKSDKTTRQEYINDKKKEIRGFK